MREFLDTNVLVYAFSVDAKSAVAEKILARRCIIGVQCLNEFANVARRKLKMDWPDLETALAAIRILCPDVVPMKVEHHRTAIRLARRYGFAVFDSLIIASALASGCEILWSEDMHHGMRIDDHLTILNPFLPDAPRSR